jgi:hypothetical protein
MYLYTERKQRLSFVYVPRIVIEWKTLEIIMETGQIILISGYI